MGDDGGRVRDQFGTNYLGHFVVVNRLVPLLAASAPARVVLLTSAGHRISDIDLDDPGFDSTPYDVWIAYGRSKTAAGAATSVWAGVRGRQRHRRSLLRELPRR